MSPAPPSAAGSAPGAPHPINGRTQVYGLLGHPIAGSLSPIMHNAGFAALGLNAAYLPFPVLPGQLGTAVRGL
ncbi:MAG TPA: hypothetical protein VL359_12995, partial [bacterium]|nr:hypothetical protein [bacterium]